MSRFFKVIALVAIAGLLTGGVVSAETILDEVIVPVNGEMGGAFTFTVTSIDIASGVESDPPVMDFDPSGVTIVDPWAIADDALRVQYSANYGEWGITLSTDNLTNIPGMAPLPTHAGDDGVWGTADDGVSYAGLIGNPIEDPAMRAVYGWQAFNMDPDGTLPDTPDLDIIDDNQNGTAQEDEICGEWNADWRYVADVNNLTYNPLSGNPNHLDPYDTSWIYDLTAPDDLYNYLYSIYGFANGLSLLPAKISDANVMADATGDVAIYGTGRFVGKTAEGDDFILPAGSYSTSLYVRIIHL